MNQEMTALAIDFEGALRDSSGLDERLAAILTRGFKEVAGSIVLSDFADSVRGESERLFDETDLEAFANHVHIEDVLVDAAPSEINHQAALFVGRLVEELRRTYPRRAFVVVMTVTDSTIVRFHEDRPGKSWLADDLDSYGGEAILQLRIVAR